MAPRVNYPASLRKYIAKYGLQSKLSSIRSILGRDTQSVIEWAEKEAKRRMQEGGLPKNYNLGKAIYELTGEEAAVKLVRMNHQKGRLTTKSQIRSQTGRNPEMPVLYRKAGLRHPQEARNLRHNLFHNSFVALIKILFPTVDIVVPTTGGGLTPDLLITHHEPDWTISVEYKGYRSITLLSESEILKGMRYQSEYGSAWLVTSTSKNVRDLYPDTLNSEVLVANGLERLRKIAKKRAYTNEQKENRAIARKGMKHLEKHNDLKLRCKLVTAEDLLTSCKNGKPLKGLAITTGMEYTAILRQYGLHQEADDVLRVMKSPTELLHSDKITSVRLIE